MFSAAVSSRMPAEPSGWSERTTTVRRTVIVDAHDLEEKQMLNWLLRARRGRGDGRAARRGPEAVGRRVGRGSVRRLLRRLMRGPRLLAPSHAKTASGQPEPAERMDAAAQPAPSGRASSDGACAGTIIEKTGARCSWASTSRQIPAAPGWPP